MDPVQLSNIRHIQSASESGKLVIFVGAGVSSNSGVPSWRGLIDAMKRELPTSLKGEVDDLKIAQMYKDSRGCKEYMDKVKETLKYNQTIPNPIHKVILDLLPVHIITTNYDDLLEQEINKEYRQYSIIRQDSDLPNMSYPNALIKMHGDFVANNIVLAEDDYYAYHRKFALIRAYVQSLFASKLVVFVGFSFADLNLKIILDEVREILHEQMQPVYLISVDKPDDATLKYFDNKNVRIVYLENEMIKRMLTKSNIKHSLVVDKMHPKGQYIWDILTLIKSYDFAEEHDLINYIYKKMNRHKDEMRVYGRGLRYFFPNSLERFIWNEHSDGLQTALPYFDDLAKKISTREGKVRVIQKYGKDICRDFFRLAYYNYLYTIDSLRVISDYSYHGLRNLIAPNVSDYIATFDFEALSERLKELSGRDVSCTIDDLEYGYAFYKLGDYYRAYLEFDKILPLAWEKGKYILYFICLYNIHTLRYLIRNQFIWEENPDVDIDKLVKKLNDIDLQRTLDKLPLPLEIRRIFQDVLGHKYIGEHAAETEELKEKIHQQKKSSQRGGISMNSNILSLEGKYEREIRFGKYNFILNDVSKLFYSVTRNTLFGILNSYATKDRERNNQNYYFQNSRIESFGISELEVLIFGLSNQELREACRQYEVDDFKIDESGREYLLNCIEHLKSNLLKKYSTSQIRKSLLNLLYVLSRSELIEDLNKDGLYAVVTELLTYKYVSDLGQFLEVIIYKYPPTEEVAQTLLNKILSDLTTSDRLDDTIEELCSVLNKYGFKFDTYPQCLQREGSLYVMLPIYDILNADDQQRFLSEFLPKIKHFGHYMHFLFTKKIAPSPIEDFKKRLFDYSDNFEINISAVCRYLSEWRNNDLYKKLWPIIDEYASKSECMKFFLAPDQYPDTQKVKPEWIRNLRTNISKELVKKQPYAHMMLEYITNTYMPPARRLSMLHIFEPNDNDHNE
ncbi:hypothetical protein HDR70_03600 [bacterium]|nr:hypothetical protein [bacterium]